MGRGLSKLQKTILEMAYKNHTEDTEVEPGKQSARIILLDNPEEKDLRALVPEAFSRYPDGLWKEYPHSPQPFLLVVETFTWPSPAQSEKREALINNLKGRGLNPKDSWGGAYQCDLWTSEALCEIYGFKERFRPAIEHPTGFPKARIVRKWVNAHTEGSNLNAARVAVSRAFDRLAARGLAERRGMAINLTENGVEAAKGLSVNGHYIVTSINQ